MLDPADLVIDRHTPRQPWAWRFGDRPEPAAAGGLAFRAVPGSDLFYMPGIRDVRALGALTREVDQRFTVSAEVEVEGGAFADAAGLLLRSPSAWLKLCIEQTRSGGWGVVAVYGAPVADESHGPLLPRGAGGLLLTREDQRVAAFWRPPEEQTWRFLRTLWWPDEEPLHVGLFAQAPFSDGHWARFSNVTLDPSALADRR